ncbi:MAG: tRNA epoxyqueuosine(34) reductase QueG, partial [Anaerolineales bacterium]|nr:tRNA epoxyqueuosine(34) reductase QueG [Anaerolineales bacterium]
MLALKNAIKTEAQRLGFELVGVTSPDPPAHLEVYQAWVQAGRHAEMGYLASERALLHRADPLRILPACQSILVLGIRYPAPLEQPDAEALSGRGQVAAYAWGADYHEVLPARLQALVAFIETRVGRAIPNRWYTDTGPLLERELAQRAGLGWIGKNTCLINPRHGSYFLLAEILLGLSLPLDEPLITDHCGSCTRCVQACPTGCIRPDRTLEAGRCLSYLTIELKAAIPPELRHSLGDWIFGCDICQQVCPWNQRFAQAEGDWAFAAAPRQDRAADIGQDMPGT